VTHIYQIFYDEKTRATLDPGFIPLDNAANERPDWREYWAIREFLLGETLKEDGYYGFFSPKFRQKTSLESSQVKEFIETGARNADVVIFSPFFDISGLFLNVFRQGEHFHPGLLQTAQDFVDRLGLTVSLECMVNDSRNTIFCNYFVARAAFWKKWLEVGEALFECAESAAPGDGLAARLNAVARVRDGVAVQMKVFVMERIATLLLALDGTFAPTAYSPFLLGTSNTAFSRFQLEAIMSDALKISMVDQKHGAYGDALSYLHGRVTEAINGKP